MICQPIKYRTRIVLMIASVAVFAGFYHHISSKQHEKNPTDTTIPTFHQLKEGFAKIFTKDRYGDRWIVVDLKATGYRLFVGMGLGVAFSIAVGMLMGC